MSKFYPGTMSNEVNRAELQTFEKEKVKQYTNGEITVYWQPEKCIHSANCILGNPAVFNAQKRPWINMKGANTEEVIRTVDTCPSRALLYKRHREEPFLPPVKKSPASGKAHVQILKNGPALISGNFIILDSDNQLIRVEKEIIALCRCGASGKKPFCDGNHSRIGFKD